MFVLWFFFGVFLKFIILIIFNFKIIIYERKEIKENLERMVDYWCKNVGDVVLLFDFFVGNCVCFSGLLYIIVENYEDEKVWE